MRETIPYEKCDNASEAYRNVQSNLSEDLLTQFKVKATIVHDDAGRKIMAQGKGFEINLLFHEDHAEIEANFGIFLRPFAGKIMDALRDELSKFL